MRVPPTNALKKTLALFVAGQMLVATCPFDGTAYAVQAPAAQQPQGGLAAGDIEQLVAPIALYPDALVAQVLAGSTFPPQVVEATKWVQQNSKLKPEELAKAVEKQTWDQSIKALTQFPSVLDNMNKNLSWTSALGDAYFNQPQDVLAAVQKLRKQAYDAGNLKTTKEQTVTTQGQTIIIQPANPQVVYVPTYSTTVVYGAPVPPPPGYSGADMAAASMVSFGVGMLVGAAIANNSYGYNSWNCNWHGGTVVVNNNTYVSNSNNYNRNTNVNNTQNVNRTTNANTNANVNRNTANANTTAAQGGNAANRSAASTGASPNANKAQPSANAARSPQASANTARSPQGQSGASRGSAQASPTATANRAQTSGSRGYGQANAGTKSSGFSDYGAGGSTASAQSRGQSSVSGKGGGRSSGGGGGGRRR